MKRNLLIVLMIFLGSVMLNAQSFKTFDFQSETIGDASADGEITQGWTSNGDTDDTGEQPEYAYDPTGGENIVLSTSITNEDARYAGAATEQLQNIDFDDVNNVVTARIYRTAGDGLIRCRVESGNEDGAPSGVTTKAVSAADGTEVRTNGEWVDVKFNFTVANAKNYTWNKLLFQVNFYNGGGAHPDDGATLYVDDIVVPYFGTATGNNKIQIQGLTVYSNDQGILLHGDTDVDEVVVSDITGKVIESVSGSRLSRVEIPNFTSGIYIVTVRSDQAVSNYKILKQ